MSTLLAHGTQVGTTSGLQVYNKLCAQNASKPWLQRYLLPILASHLFSDNLLAILCDG